MENNQAKDNVFCVDCHGWQEQVYRGNFKDGSHTYKRYICCQCGTENDVEDKAKKQAINRIATEYREKIPQKVYEALINWIPDYIEY